jgi:hypothetical protein
MGPAGGAHVVLSRQKGDLVGYPDNYLETAVERCVVGAGGASRAHVEQVLLADGRRVIVKRVAPRDDLMMALTGDEVGREYLLWTQGVLDQLPALVSHAVIDAWIDGDTAVVVMDDVTDVLFGQSCRLARATADSVLAATAAMHERFLGQQPHGLTPLHLLLSRFAPQRMRLFVGCGSELPDRVLRSWEAFDDLVTDDMSAAVFALLADPQPLARALSARPCTVVHGDLATSHMGMRDGRLILLDWSVSAVAPAALDVALLLARSPAPLNIPPEQVFAEHARSAAEAADAVGLRLAVLAAVLVAGWRLASVVTHHPDEAARQRAWSDLEWWVREARLTLDAALI